MNKQHCKMQVFDQDAFGLLNFNCIWDHQKGAEGKPKIAASNSFGGPKLSGIDMREVKVEGEIGYADHNQDNKLVHYLSSENHPQQLMVGHFLLTVEFPQQSNLIHSNNWFVLNIYFNIYYSAQSNICDAVALCTIYNNSIMSHRNRCKTVWRRKNTEYSRLDKLDQDPSFEQLKSLSKRLAIESRLQKKQIPKGDYTKQNNSSKLNLTNQKDNDGPSNKIRRPLTTSENRKKKVINYAQQAYHEERRRNEVLIAQKYENTVKTSFTNVSNSVKEGLLGQYQKYNLLTKQQLIQKLISLEYLANNIFKKNKMLEQKIKSLEANKAN